MSFAAEPRVRGLLYRLPTQALLDNAMAAVPLGIARGAIDTLVVLAGGERPTASSSPTPLAERVPIQADGGGQRRSTVPPAPFSTNQSRSHGKPCRLAGHCRSRSWRCCALPAPTPSKPPSRPSI